MGATRPIPASIKKWADKYGISIELKQFNDYVNRSINTHRGFDDAMTITNMDALSIPPPAASIPRPS